MTRLAPTALSLAFAAVLVVAASADVLLVGATVFIVQVVISQAPPPADDRGRSVTTPKAAATVLAGLVATLLTLRPRLLDGADGVRSTIDSTVISGTIAGVIPATALGLVVVLISQMLRRDGRRALVISTAYSTTLIVLATLTVGWITAVQAVDGSEVVRVCAAALAAALLVWSIPLDPWIGGSLAVTAGAVGGVLVTVFTSTFLTPLFGITIGTGVAVLAVLGQVLGRGWTAGRRHAAPSWALPGALSLAVTGPLVHLAGQLVTAF